MGCTFSQSFAGQKWIKAVTPICWHYSRLGQIPTYAVGSVLGHISFALWFVKQRNGPRDRGATFLMCPKWLGRGLAKAESQLEVLINGCADSCGWVGHSSTHLFQSEKVTVSTWVLCTGFMILSPVQVRKMPRAISVSQWSLGPV